MSNSSELKRDAVIRKSIRIPNKRMAPAPPPLLRGDQQVDSIDIDQQHYPSAIVDSLQQKQSIANNNNNGHGVGENNNEMRTSPGLIRFPPPPLLARKFVKKSSDATPSETSSTPLPLTTSIRSPMKYNSVYRVEIKDQGNLKLSDIMPGATAAPAKDKQPAAPVPFPSPSTSATSRARKEFLQIDDDSSSTRELENIENQINNIFLNTPAIDEQSATTEKQPTGSPMLYKKVSKRYGEQENLLKTGISDLHSGTGLAYIDNNNEDDVQPIEFKRGVDGRNSTGGAVSFASKLFQFNKPKPPKPVARTSSDTKSVEATMQIVRAKMNEMKDRELKDRETKERDLKNRRNETNVNVLHTHNQSKVDEKPSINCLKRRPDIGTASGDRSIEHRYTARVAAPSVLPPHSRHTNDIQV